MDSIYFKDPLGLLIELAAYRFEPPAGRTHADVLLEAHSIRVARGDYNIAEIHLADAIEDAGYAFPRVAVERSRTAGPLPGTAIYPVRSRVRRSHENWLAGQ